MRRGRCGYDVTMLMMETVGKGGGGRVEVCGGSVKGERNRRQWDDYQGDIVLVLVTKSSHINFPPFILPLAWLSHLKIKESGEA